MANHKIPEKYWHCLPPMKQLELEVEKFTGEPVIFADTKMRTIITLLVDRIAALEKEIKSHGHRSSSSYEGGHGDPFVPRI